MCGRDKFPADASGQRQFAGPQSCPVFAFRPTPVRAILPRDISWDLDIINNERATVVLSWI